MAGMISNWFSRWVLMVAIGLSTAVWLVADTDLGARAVQGSLDEEQERAAEAAAWFATGLAMQSAGKTAEAMEAFANSASLDPTNLPVVEQVIPYLLSVKANDKAVSILQKAIRLYPERENLRSLLGMSLIASNRLDEALELNLKTLDEDPESLAAFRSILMVYFQEGQQDKVEEIIGKAFAVEERSASGWIQMGGILAQFIKSGQASGSNLEEHVATALDNARKASPDNPEITLQAGTLYEEIGQTEEAITCYEEILQNDRVPTSVRTRLAFLYLQTDQMDKAGDLAGQIIEKEPLNPFGYRISGYIAQQNDDWEAASEYFAKAVKYAPAFEPGYYDLVTAYINIKKNDQARDILEKISFRFQPSFQFHYFTGMLDAREEKFPEALESYKKALALAEESEPERLNHFFFFQMGVACERSKRIEESEKYFNRALEMNPEFAEAMNYLGYTYADNDMKLDKALELILKAVEMEPENSAFLDSLGWVYFKMESYKDALRYQLKAVEFADTPDPIMYDHLGDIYLKLNRPTKAKESWEKALEFDADGEVSGNISKKLKELESIQVSDE